MASLDEISQAIGALQSDVKHLSNAVAENSQATRAVVAKVNRYEQRIIGISTTVSSVIAFIGTGIVAKLKGLI